MIPLLCTIQGQTTIPILVEYLIRMVVSSHLTVLGSLLTASVKFLPQDSGTSKEPVLWARCPVRGYLLTSSPTLLSLMDLHVCTLMHTHFLFTHSYAITDPFTHFSLTHTHEVPHSHTPAVVPPFADCLLCTMYCARLRHKAEMYKT